MSWAVDKESERVFLVSCRTIHNSVLVSLAVFLTTFEEDESHYKSTRDVRFKFEILNDWNARTLRGLS